MKINTARSFATRVLSLSHWRFKFENYNTIRQILEKNNYPEHIIKKVIKEATYIKMNKERKERQQNNEHNQNTNNSRNTESFNSTNVTVRKEGSKSIYKSLTYVPQLSEKISKKIRRVNPEIKIAPKPSHQLRNHYSKLKDSTKKEDKCNIIYKVKCQEDCGKEYIGQTCRKLKERLNEHKSYINKKSPLSGLAAHAIETNHIFNFDDTSIIGTENHRKKRETKETIKIYENKNNLVNIKQDAYSFKKAYHKIVTFPNHNQQRPHQ